MHWMKFCNDGSWRKADEHPHYPRFFDYGDAEAYAGGLQDLRRDEDDGQTFDRPRGLA